MRTSGPIGFDLDLTLIDSRSAIMAAWSAVAADFDVRIELDEVDQRMGIKLEDEVAYWFPADRQQAATASYRRHYIRLAPSLTTLLPGAEAALAAVREASARSSSPPSIRCRCGRAWRQWHLSRMICSRTCTVRRRRRSWCASAPSLMWATRQPT